MRESELFGHIRASAPGKVNLSLRVGPLRADGYHQIATLFCAVSLTEEVAASPRDDGLITVALAAHSQYGQTLQPAAAGPEPVTTASAVPQSAASATVGPEAAEQSAGPAQLSPGEEPRHSPVMMPVDQHNIAYRAALILRDYLQSQGRDVSSFGVDLVITKRVPIAGGMGGGSADAAATLLACAALWDAQLGKAELAGLGAQLGADVPFALMGEVALGEGVGEQLTPLLCRGRLHLVLVPSQEGLSTPAVYRQVDLLREQAGSTVDRAEVDAEISAAVSSGDATRLAGLMVNDMEPAAVSLMPELDTVLDAGLSAGALQGMVSGSGPTVVFLTAGEEQAGKLAVALERRLGRPAIAVTAPAAGAQLL